jgi:hypothetical protein
MVENWASKMAGAGDAYTKGIQSTTVDPAEAAIAQQPRMLSGIQQAVTSGRWAAGLRRAAAKGTWKTNAITKGAQRLATGALQAKQKMMEHATAIYPVNQDIRNTIATMAKGGTENAVARIRVMLQKYADFKAAKAQS